MSLDHKRVTRNLKAKLLEALATIAASIMTYVLLTRSYTPTEVGLYALILTCLFFVESFALQLGIGSLAVREMSRDRTDRCRSEVLSNATVAQTILAIVWCLILPLIGWLFPSQRDLCFTLALPLLLLAATLIISHTEAIVISAEEIPSAALARSLGLLLGLLMTALCCALRFPIEYAALSAPAGRLCGLFILLVQSKAYTYFRLSVVKRAKAVSIVVQSLSICVMAISCALYVRVDILMIDWMIGRTAVGHYSAAYAILDNLMILSNVVMGAVFPTFTRLATEDSAAFKELYQRMIGLVFRILVPCALIVGLLAEKLLYGLYGTEYAEAATTVRWLMLAAFFAWLNGPSSTIFFAHNKHHLYAVGTVMALAVNVGANLILIPSMGTDGAAVATALTEIALCVFSFVMIKRSIGHLPYLSK